MKKLIKLLDELEKRKIYYKLNKIRESVLVEVAVPGQRWEIEIFDDEHIEIEVFKSDGVLSGEEKLEELFRDFSDDPPAGTVVVQTTRNLYDMMLQRSDLCGSYKLTSSEGEYAYDSIVWTIGDAVIQLCVGHGNGFISLGDNKKSKEKPKRDLAHWFPELDEIFDEVVRIGTKGNITVVCSDLRGEGSLLYSGSKEDCPYLPPKKHLLKKYFFIEAK